MSENRVIKAIWGIGLYGSKFSVKLGRDGFDFFIDKNPWKNQHMGHDVRHPDSIDHVLWKNIFIYVPFNHYEEIKEYLEGKGLTEKMDFVCYGSKLGIDEITAFAEFERFKEEIKTMLLEGDWSGKTVIWGRVWQKKEYLDFIEQLKYNGFQVAVLSEAIWQSSHEASEILGVPVVTAPFYADEESIIISDAELDRDNIPEDLFNREVEHLKGIQGKCEGNIEYTIERIYEYIEYALDRLNIKRIICMGSVTVQNQLLNELCKKKGIEEIFTSQGVLPGTIAIDIYGEVGMSIPAVKTKLFSNLPISIEDTNEAEKVISSLRANGNNRKAQPRTNWKNIVNSKRVETWPIILYLGQNDPFSHMIPYDNEAQKWFSPVFKSTEEGLVFLSELCEKNHWNLIFKPHPMYIYSIDESALPRNVIYVPFGDINEMIDYSDVAITILSSANYISLIRNTAVVMLGYNQIKGKGCVYEAYEKKCIEGKIKDALKYGFTEEQQQAFTKHVAQCLKYYLFDDLQHPELSYGRPVPSNLEDLYELERAVDNNGLF